MIKKALLLAGILVVFPTTKAHPATDNDTTEVVYADTTGIDIDSIGAAGRRSRIGLTLAIRN